MNAQPVFPFEVSSLAFALVFGLWAITLVAAIFRWRVFDRIRVVYRFATEFERRVHRRFSDTGRQRTPFGSVVAKLADASTAALSEEEGGRAAKRLAQRHHKNSGDEMLALLQRSLIGEAGGWTPTPDNASSNLVTVGHAVRFALNENPILARVGPTSLSLAHRATDCAPWALCLLSASASASLIALSLQLVGGPDVFASPSFVGFAVCLSPVISAGVLSAFLYVFYRFFDPERLYDRTVQKLTNSMEVLWQDASQRNLDGDLRLPSDVNAPVPQNQMAQVARQENVSDEEMRFLTGNLAETNASSEPSDFPPEEGDAAALEEFTPEDSDEVTVLADLPTEPVWNPPVNTPIVAAGAGSSLVMVPMAAPEAPAVPAPAPAEVPSAPIALGPVMEERSALEEWSLSPPMTPTPPTVASPADEVSEDADPVTLPGFTLPQEMAEVPVPLWPENTVSPEAPSDVPQEAPAPVAAAPIALPAPRTAPIPAMPVPAPEVEEHTEWAALAPLPEFQFSTPDTLPSPVVTPPPAEEATVWNTPMAPSPAAEATPAPSVPLWSEAPVVPTPPPAPAPRPSVTVRRAANAPVPAPTATSERTGEWSLSGSHDVRPVEAPVKEEITQEVPLRPVSPAVSGTGSAAPTVVRRAAAPVPPAPAVTPAENNLWNNSTTTESDSDKAAVLRHRLAMVEQYLQKATVDFSQGAISEAMWQEETERWSLEREKLVRELALLTAKKRASDAA